MLTCLEQLSPRMTVMGCLFKHSSTKLAMPGCKQGHKWIYTILITFLLLYRIAVTWRHDFTWRCLACDISRKMLEIKFWNLSLKWQRRHLCPLLVLNISTLERHHSPAPTKHGWPLEIYNIPLRWWSEFERCSGAFQMVHIPHQRWNGLKPQKANI